MANESESLHPNGTATPIPDPTFLTTAALTREIAALKELLETRLNGMDAAQELFDRNLHQVPSEVDKQVGHLKELHDEKFESVGKQFLERDTRGERESRDNKVAVDAAFAAQKEAAAKQDEANQKAIDKSEKATGETLNKQADLFKSTTDALQAQIADLKERLTRFESLAQQIAGITSQIQALAQSRDEGTGRFQHRETSGASMTTIMFGVIAVASLISTVIIAVVK